MITIHFNIKSIDWWFNRVLYYGLIMGLNLLDKQVSTQQVTYTHVCCWKSFWKVYSNPSLAYSCLQANVTCFIAAKEINS